MQDRIPGDILAGLGTKQDADGRIVALGTFPFVVHPHIHVHLTDVLMRDPGGLQVDQHEAFQDVVVEDQVDEVVMGCVLQGGLGQNVARQMMLDAGLPVEVPCFTINKVCGSGLRAVELAAQIIKAGDADVVVAGGAENMSATGYAVPAARWGARMFDAKMTDMMVNDGLWDAFNNYHIR